MAITGGFRTLRLSATSGTRTIASMIASDTYAGAGSTARIYKWLYHYQHVSPQQFVQGYLRYNPTAANQLLQLRFY